MYKPIAKMTYPEGSERYYYVKVDCSNCGNEQSLYFKYGDLVSETACPVCECLTLNKI